MGVLDGFNQYRFYHHPALLVAWKSARHTVAEPQPQRDDTAVPLTPGQPAASSSLGPQVSLG